MKTLTLATTLIASLFAFNTQANEQHYTFTYDFTKPQDSVVYIANQTSDYIQYQTALDIIYASNATINEVGKQSEAYAINMEDSDLVDTQQLIAAEDE